LEAFSPKAALSPTDLNHHRIRAEKIAATAAFGGNGAPRPMKMGTTRSPCRYDAAARRALQSVNLRRAAILHYALWGV
jgi:hypothetical protein